MDVLSFLLIHILVEVLIWCSFSSLACWLCSEFWLPYLGNAWF